jgi:hypothetical protein
MRKITIMETDSENTQVEKRKRGRPRKFDYTRLDKHSQQFGAKTRRGQQNHEYAGQAYMTLFLVREEGGPDWIAPLLERVRPSVFAELGRCLEMEDPTVFWQCARYLAENDVSAKKAIAVIRRQRLGEPPDVLPRMRLHDALVRTINEHLARYPDTTDKQILEALFVTSKAVEERMED